MVMRVVNPRQDPRLALSGVAHIDLTDQDEFHTAWLNNAPAVGGHLPRARPGRLRFDVPFGLPVVGFPRRLPTYEQCIQTWLPPPEVDRPGRQQNNNAR